MCALSLAMPACGGDGRSPDASSPASSDEREAPTVRVPNDATPTAVDVGGYEMVVRCSGRGRPAVVLEAGLGLSSGRWRKTQPLVARRNRVCAYDRSGLGRSDDRPRDVDRSIAEELHVLLGAIGLPPPYVLAGHSAGGAYISEYASSYPDEVLGLVFVDAAVPSSLPDELADVPVVVLVAGYGRDPGSFSAGAAVSSNTVDAVALESGHHIQAGQPDVVARAIGGVAEAGRTNTALPRCRELFAGLAVACP